ncbi:hypothetical protein FGO68_gene15642 [Halteria grandinella]|uniref:Uncharacterized protein n=1 Tax=Halteria grandinella TaxID=5974 RepID=A0A8J8NA25_HALGN|nr:hypothetical protein FGO68_gene15642 [Halteria grandinella]
MKSSKQSQREPTREFILEVCDISSYEACIVFEHLPYTVSRKSIEFFEMRLWKEGSTKSIGEIKKISQRGRPQSAAIHNQESIDKRPIFEVEIKGNEADAYTLHNLDPATIYKAQMKIYVIDNTSRGNPLQQKSTGSFAPPEKKKIVYKITELQPILFATHQKPIDDFISEELDRAREMKREKSRRLPLAKSERVLYEFSKDQNFGLFPSKVSSGENIEQLKEAIKAARNHKDWRDYAMCGYKFSQEPSLRDKRVNRYMLIGQAIDAFEDVPKEPKGSSFMKNDWFMGPFYAWDKNFLQYMPTK